MQRIGEMIGVKGKGTTRVVWGFLITLQEPKATGDDGLFGDPWQGYKGHEDDSVNEDKKEGVPSKARVEWEEEEEEGGSVASSVKGSASGMLTVSKEEVAKMVAPPKALPLLS